MFSFLSNLRHGVGSNLNPTQESKPQSNRDSESTQRPHGAEGPGPSITSRHVRFAGDTASSSISQEEATNNFVPNNPFEWRNRFHELDTARNDIEAQRLFASPEQQHGQKETPQVTYNRSFLASLLCLAQIGSYKSTSPHSDSLSLSSTESKIFGPETRLYLTDIFPRQIYLHLHLRLPALYFSRVARIFEDAEVSKPDVQHIVNMYRQSKRQVQTNNGGDSGRASTGRNTSVYVNSGGGSGRTSRNTSMNVSGREDTVFTSVSGVSWRDMETYNGGSEVDISGLVRFKESWEAFISALIKEWKTLNVVSALLLSAIMTMFQIQQAAEDTVTRTAAFLSLICALMSLSYGCVYIVRFGAMKGMMRASKWVEESQKSRTAIMWNVWIMLALPAVWLAWSMVAFIVSILSLVWRGNWRSRPNNSDTLGEPSSMVWSDSQLPPILVTTVFVLGLMYFALIVDTLTRYSHGQGNGAKRRGR